MISKKDFYNVLFNPGEGIGYQTDHGEYRKNRVVVHKQDQDSYNFDYHFYSINPIHPTKDNAPDPNNPKEGPAIPRIKIANVTAFRNFAIEFDEGTLREQSDKLKSSGMPYSAIIFSGKKSLHCPIALEEEVNQEDYSAIFEAINQTLLKFELKLDPQCKNPNRLTRAPGQTRFNTDKEQKLLLLKSRIPNQTLFDWFNENGVNWKDYRWKVKEAQINYDGPGDADQEQRWDAAVQSCEWFNGRYAVAEQWQPWLFELGKWCKAYAVEEGLAIQKAGLHFEYPTPNAIPTAIKNGYKYGKLTPRTLMKPKLKSEEELDLFDQLFHGFDDTIINGDPANFNANGIRDYIKVGSKFYRSDAVGIELWDKSSIRDALGPRALVDPELRHFRGFCNEPNYLTNVEWITRNIGGEQHTFYNRFRRPDWKLKEGEWPTTLKLLQKVFIGDSEDQLEVGLDWIQLLLTKPKQMTRSLVLVGQHGTGKDTFMEWLIKIVGQANGIIIGGEELESNFNTLWAGKHLVCLNEVSYDLSNKKVKEKIKNLITGEKISIEGKGDNSYQVENYTKVIMATNNMYDFMKIDDTEDRFWVREMPALKDGDKVANFVELLHAEIPYFLHWIIKQRQLWKTKKEGRFWHSNADTRTAANQRVVENTKSNLYSEIHELLVMRFNQTELRDKNQLYCRPSTMKGFLSDNPKLKHVKLCMLKEFGIKDWKQLRADAFDDFKVSNQQYFEISRELLGLEMLTEEQDVFNL